ncbi:transglutaminaseTgpA domain-containing protein [Candidatus Blastococcus massiliensis]|uniref:transglutaminase family protein n=1 Tax=Candidatus Blastococcus massiliensis TaxID=1470358 RepID=UPI0009DED785|nr:DUF3488 and transglutaminase-like domain-containing protein [Candidatus Blastococcus massiliensis]
MRPLDVRTPLTAAAATVLGALALGPVLSPGPWLRPVVAAVLVVALAGLALRAAGATIGVRAFPDRPPPEALATLGTVLVPLGQLFALACWLTVRFASEGAFGGVVPTPASLEVLVAVLGDGADEIREQMAPARPVAPLMAVITVFVGLVAVLVDLVAVAARQAALAGLGLLVLFCVPVFTLTGGIGVLAVVAPAAGFALLLWADQCRRVGAGSREGGGRQGGGRGTGAGTATRIGAAAVLVGLIGGGLLPTLAEGALTGSGAGGSTGTAINPMTTMVGQLTLRDPVDLLRVESSVEDPGYLRVVTLDHYDAEGGWSPAGLKARLPLNAPLRPAGNGNTDRSVTATIEAIGHDDRFLPVPVAPVTVRMDGGENGWRFDPDAGTVIGNRQTSEGRRYEVTAVEPRPTPELLAAAAEPNPEYSIVERNTALPRLDQRVVDEVDRLVAGAVDGYDRVRRILDFLTDRGNGFRYSLATPPGTSGDDLVDFLTEKRGYCEQYAGAMAVMVRQAGMPARVALGYTTGTAQDDDSRLITTDDAHAWVEVYFLGVGWVPFDPTPIDEDRRADLPWAPRVAPEERPEFESDRPAPAPELSVVEPMLPEEPVGEAPVEATGPASSGGRAWGVAAGVALLVAATGTLPAGLRVLQRRRRLARGSATALWDELAATVDDLGQFRDPAWTPREAGRAFAGRTVGPAGAEAVGRLARAEERASYGRVPGAPEEGLDEALHTARRELSRVVHRRARLRAVFWPASLAADLRTRAAAWSDRTAALPRPWRRDSRPV